MYKKRPVIYLLSLFICSLLLGCIKENNDGCAVTIPGNVYLGFRYFADGIKDVFPTYIGKVNLFVYDENEDKVAEYVLDNSVLISTQGISLNLDEGRYKIVCWGNIYDNTEMRATDNLGKAIICHPNYFNDSAIKSNDRLYYGAYDIVVPESGNVIEFIDFRSAHINIDVYVKGSGISMDNIPDVEITNLYAQYDFMMNKVPNPESGELRKANYYPNSEYDNENKCSVARTYVLNFENRNSVSVIIKKPSDNINLFSLNLADFLMENNIDVENTQESAVSILFTMDKDLSITVSVPEWESPDVKPEI